MSRSSSNIFSEFNQAIGFNLINGYSRVAQLGHNSDIDTGSTPEDIWEGGGTINWLSSASILEVLSSDVNDTSAGTGARTVFVSGLNSDYDVITETVTLNGTSAVQTVNSYLRINTFLINSAGSNKTNVGSITLRVTGGGSVQSLMASGIGFARSSAFTVPAGFTLSVNSMVFSITRAGGSRYATISTFIQSPNGFYRLPLELGIYNENPYRHDGLPGVILTEKTDFCLRCTSVSNDNTDLTAGWLGVLKKNVIS